MNALAQAGRIGRLSTVLGQDVLVLRQFSGTDAMNELFEFDVDVLSVKDDIDFDALIGTHATVCVVSNGGDVYHDGIVTEARWLGPGPSGWQYRLKLRPWLWVTGRRRNQRIFHEKTVVEIITEVWADHAHLGTPHVRDDLSGDYPTLEYTVQYRESDMDFTRRLMERFGINFHFHHEDGNHVLVLSDAVATHDSIGERPFYVSNQNMDTNLEHFSDWGPYRRLVTGAIRLMDYNFKKPKQAMEADAMGDAAYPNGQIESYDFPGDYLDQGIGRTMASLRLDEERGGDARISATSDIIGLHGGKVVALGGGDYVPGDGAEYLCLKTDFVFRAQGYGTGDSEDTQDDRAFEARHILLPVGEPMVPPRVTARALVHGPQTGTVVGEGEIDCDEYGRILVHPNWDLDEAYTMRCRVSQNWASKGWGGMVIPRIGMEVVIEFIEGDPDMPLVTGCVYNGKNDVPYDLPAHKTRSTFKTDTHQGEGFNELRFEDEKDQEEIFVHAQKDMNIEVLNDRSKRVEVDQSEVVGNDKSIQVGGDHSEVVSGNMSIAVGSNPLSKTLMNKTQVLFSKLGGVMEKMKLPDMLNFAKGNYQIFIEKNKSEIVNVASSEVVGVAKSTVVGQSFQQTVGKAMSTLVRGRWESDVGQVQVMRVGDQITIQVGENSTLTMSKEGDIVMKGKHIKLEADKIDFN